MSGETQDINKKIKWDGECEDDDVYYGAKNSYGCFSKIPKWHQDFFHSLKFPIRLEPSLSQVHYGKKEATELFENAEYDRGEGLRSIMEIRRISEMIFPLVLYDIERKYLETALIACIEYEGMKARGINWWDISTKSEFEIDDLGKEEQQKRLDNYSGVLVHINDIEEMINRGSLNWRAAKYLKVWRYYLEERAIKTKPLHDHILKSEISTVDNIANWEKRVIDCYKQLGTVREVQDRGIVREDTGNPVGKTAVARVIRQYREERKTAG